MVVVQISHIRQKNHVVVDHKHRSARPINGIHFPQLSGTLLDRMQGLAKLHATAKSAMKLEIGQLTEPRASAGKGTSANGRPPTSRV